MTSHTKENYLKAIFFLADSQGTVSLSDLSEQMGVSTPTANSMVKRLAELGWVIHTKYKPLIITELGKKTAALIIRKHRIAEMFLSEKMGFGWEEVHEIAEELEHINSERFFERMNQMLGYPKIDPHGSPIPDQNGQIEKQPYIPLCQVVKGRRAYLRALTRSNKEFLIYLKQKEIELGLLVEVVDFEDFDKSQTIRLESGKTITLSVEVTTRILVDAC